MSIKAKLSFAMITLVLKGEAKHRIDNYEVYYNGQTDDVYFMVKCPEDIKLPENYNPETRERKYWFETAIDHIKKAVKDTYQKKLEDGNTIQAAVARYCDGGKSAECDVYYLDKDGNKQAITYKLI